MCDFCAFYTYEIMTKYDVKIYLQKKLQCLIVIYHVYYLRIFLRDIIFNVITSCSDINITILVMMYR